MQTEALQNIKFGVFSPDEIKAISVAKLTVPDTYNEDGYPIDNGLLDQRLGVIDPGLVCKTCGGRAKACLGHFGHIELIRPVVHPEFAKIIYMLLQSTCQSCHRILLNLEQIDQFKRKIAEELTAEEEVSEPNYENILKRLRNVKKCPHCGEVQQKLKFSMPTYFYLGENRMKPDEIRDMLAKISDEELSYIGIDAKSSRPQWFVLNLLLVPPVNVRPSITLETGERSEDDLTHKLVDIMRINQRLEQNINAGAPQIIIDDLWELLQYHVTTYFNNETSGIPPGKAQERKGTQDAGAEAQGQGRTFQVQPERKACQLLCKNSHQRGQLHSDRRSRSSDGSGREDDRPVLRDRVEHRKGEGASCEEHIPNDIEHGHFREQEEAFA